MTWGGEGPEISRERGAGSWGRLCGGPVAQHRHAAADRVTRVVRDAADGWNRGLSMVPFDARALERLTMDSRGAAMDVIWVVGK